MAQVFAFIIGIATDWLWTKYVYSISQKNAFWAANWSLAIHLCSLFATYLLIDKEYIAVIFYLIGGYAGTYLAILYSGVKNNDVSEQNNSIPLQ